jgi:hypothetical protein
MTVLFRLAQDIGHLPFERIKPLIEGRDRRLARGGFVREARGVGRPAPREHLALDLLQLAFEAFDALLWRRRLALSDCRRSRNHGGCGKGRESRN